MKRFLPQNLCLKNKKHSQIMAKINILRVTITIFCKTRNIFNHYRVSKVSAPIRSAHFSCCLRSDYYYLPDCQIYGIYIYIHKLYYVLNWFCTVYNIFTVKICLKAYYYWIYRFFWYLVAYLSFITDKMLKKMYYINYIVR